MRHILSNALPSIYMLIIRRLGAFVNLFSEFRLFAQTNIYFLFTFTTQNRIKYAYLRFVLHMNSPKPPRCGRGTAAEAETSSASFNDAVAVVGVAIRTLYQNSRSASPFMDGLAVPTQRPPRCHRAVKWEPLPPQPLLSFPSSLGQFAPLRSPSPAGRLWDRRARLHIRNGEASLSAAGGCGCGFRLGGHNTERKKASPLRGRLGGRLRPLSIG